MKYEAYTINYLDKDVEMLEEVKPSEEVTSARKPSLASLITTEDRSDYDPTEPLEWEFEYYEEEKMRPFKKKKIMEHNTEDAIDVKHPYRLYPQDKKWARDEIYGFLCPEANVEAYRRRMEGRLFKKTLYQADLKIIRLVLIIDMNDERKSNFI